MTKRLMHSLSVILLGAISACAGQPINIQIPFSFHVGNSVLPAGSYRADSDAGIGILRVRSDDGKSGVMILSNHVQANGASRQSKMVFHKYADQYFLYQVWTAGSNEGRQLLPSRSETVVAATTNGRVEAVVARR